MAKQSVQLQSTALASVEYDDETEQMEIAFRNGRSYSFTNVPQTVFENLRDAPSPGQYFQQHIKGVY